MPSAIAVAARTPRLAPIARAARPHLASASQLASAQLHAGHTHDEVVADVVAFLDLVTPFELINGAVGEAFEAVSDLLWKPVAEWIVGTQEARKFAKAVAP